MHWSIFIYIHWEAWIGILAYNPNKEMILDFSYLGWPGTMHNLKLNPVLWSGTVAEIQTSIHKIKLLKNVFTLMVVLVVGIGCNVNTEFFFKKIFCNLHTKMAWKTGVGRFSEISSTRKHLNLVAVLCKWNLKLLWIHSNGNIQWPP